MARNPEVSQRHRPEPPKVGGYRAAEEDLVLFSVKGKPSVAATLRKGPVQPSGGDVMVPQCVMHGVQGIHQDTTSLQDTITVGRGAQEIVATQKVFIHAQESVSSLLHRRRT